MGIIYVGDTHGDLRAILAVEKYCVDNDIENVVQVGDFGLSFSRGQADEVYRYFAKRARQQRPGPKWWTCGGNHDNYTTWERWSEDQGNPEVVVLAPDTYWVRRGVCLQIDGKSHLFCGGAESTDRENRREGVTWWPQETPTYAEFSLFADVLNSAQLDVVVTHDVPLRVGLWRMNRETQPTPRNLENVLKTSEYKPSLWVFGHHHVTNEFVVETTKFVCCGLGGQFWSPDTGFGGKYQR